MRRLYCAVLALSATLACGVNDQQALASELLGKGADARAALPSVGSNGVSVRVNYGNNKQCIESVAIGFPGSVSVGTLYGHVNVYGSMNYKRAFVLSEWGAGDRQFTFKPTKQFCQDHHQYDKIVLEAGVSLNNGQILRAPVITALRFGMEDGSMGGGAASWSNPTSGSRMKVTKEQLNNALRQLKMWERQERMQSFYNTSGLQILPVAGTNMIAHHTVNQKNHYGNADTIYVLRRASKFVEFLYPGEKVRVADMSSSSGDTPSTSMGTEKIYTHPEGSHRNGQDIDVTYLGTLNSANKVTVDPEKTFWFMYATLQSTSVDMLISAYRTQMIQWAQAAQQSGLINTYAQARFNKIQEDTGLNHDQHMHISVRNGQNQYKSVRFAAHDDVYSCYLALNPAYRGGDMNYCL